MPERQTIVSSAPITPDIKPFRQISAPAGAFGDYSGVIAAGNAAQQVGLRGAGVFAELKKREQYDTFLTQSNAVNQAYRDALDQTLSNDETSDGFAARTSGNAETYAVGKFQERLGELLGDGANASIGPEFDSRLKEHTAQTIARFTSQFRENDGRIRVAQRTGRTIDAAMPNLDGVNDMALALKTMQSSLALVDSAPGIDTKSAKVAVRAGLVRWARYKGVDGVLLTKDEFIAARGEMMKMGFTDPEISDALDYAKPSKENFNRVINASMQALRGGNDKAASDVLEAINQGVASDALTDTEAQNQMRDLAKTVYSNGVLTVPDGTSLKNLEVIKAALDGNDPARVRIAVEDTASGSDVQDAISTVELTDKDYAELGKVYLGTIQSRLDLFKPGADGQQLVQGDANVFGAKQRLVDYASTGSASADELGSRLEAYQLSVRDALTEIGHPDSEAVASQSYPSELMQPLISKITSGDAKQRAAGIANVFSLSEQLGSSFIQGIARTAFNSNNPESRYIGMSLVMSPSHIGPGSTQEQSANALKIFDALFKAQKDTVRIDQAYKEKRFTESNVLAALTNATYSADADIYDVIQRGVVTGDTGEPGNDYLAGFRTMLTRSGMDVASGELQQALMNLIATEAINYDGGSIRSLQRAAAKVPQMFGEMGIFPVRFSLPTGETKVSIGQLPATQRAEFLATTKNGEYESFDQMHKVFQASAEYLGRTIFEQDKNAVRSDGRYAINGYSLENRASLANWGDLLRQSAQSWQYAKRLSVPFFNDFDPNNITHTTENRAALGLPERVSLSFLPESANTDPAFAQMLSRFGGDVVKGQARENMILGSTWPEIHNGEVYLFTRNAAIRGIGVKGLRLGNDERVVAKIGDASTLLAVTDFIHMKGTFTGRQKLRFDESTYNPEIASKRPKSSIVADEFGGIGVITHGAQPEEDDRSHGAQFLSYRRAKWQQEFSSK